MIATASASFRRQDSHRPGGPVGGLLLSPATCSPSSPAATSATARRSSIGHRCQPRCRDRHLCFKPASIGGCVPSSCFGCHGPFGEGAYHLILLQRPDAHHPVTRRNQPHPTSWAWSSNRPGDLPHHRERSFSPFFNLRAAGCSPRSTPWRMAFCDPRRGHVDRGPGAGLPVPAHSDHAQSSGMPTLHLAGYAAVALLPILASTLIATGFGLSTLLIACFSRHFPSAWWLFSPDSSGPGSFGPVLRKNRDLVPHLRTSPNIAIPVENLCASPSVRVDHRGRRPIRRSLNARAHRRLNAGAGMLGFPAGGCWSDVAVPAGWGRKSMNAVLHPRIQGCPHRGLRL